MKSSKGKIYPAVIIKTLSVQRIKFPKCFGEIKSKSIIFPAGFSLPIAVDFILKTRSPVSTLLRRFVAILRGRWYPSPPED